MCGITGFIGAGSQADIEAMANALFHRGPDDGGIFYKPGVALGHRRLSILDLAHGRQPMADPASGLVIVYNGEIYNHLEIRLILEKLGHFFYTRNSDTETALHAFAEWGPACFKKFNGMFSLAIYDQKNNVLWLARDRFGEKPLFYCKTAQGFAFASEIGALTLWPGFDHAWSNANIQRFFAWNYLPGSRAAHKNCQSLEPGSWLKLSIGSMQTEKNRYWQFRLNPDQSLTPKREPELVEELARLLCQAVNRRLLSDVPLGIFLSGGLDSSAVLAAACQAADPDCLQTFTIGFNEKSFDESAKAAQVAAYLHAPNHVRFLTQEQMQASIGNILGQMSEPFGDASLIPTWHLAKFARQSVKVALTGDGGDELFAGYDPMAALNPAMLYRRFAPGSLHLLARKMINLLPASDQNMSLEFKLKRMLRGLSYPENMQLPVWMSGLEPTEIDEFFEEPLTAEQLYADAIQAYNPELDAFANALLFFTCLYLPDDILVKSDRASMMVSLETRAVFLDNDIADFCSILPMHFKYRNGQRKYLLKKTLEKWLPKSIINQPKKGFGIPLNNWLRSLPAPACQPPGLKPGVITACQQQHNRRKGDYRFFLWDCQAFAAIASQERKCDF